MQGLGLIAVDQGAIGGRAGRRGVGLRDVPLLAMAPACQAGPGVPRGAEGDAVHPGGEPVGVAERRGLPGQDEEGSLESVLGKVVVAQELPADVQDHRPVAGHQRGEGVLGERRRAGR